MRTKSNRPPMAHRESSERRAAILRDAAAGMHHRAVAHKHGVSLSTVGNYVRDSRPKAPRAAPWAQAQRIASAMEAHAQWRSGHVLLCGSYPKGGCCPSCHASPAMVIIDLPNDTHAHVCCGKVLANWQALGYESSPAQRLEKLHAGTPRWRRKRQLGAAARAADNQTQAG